MLCKPPQRGWKENEVGEFLSQESKERKELHRDSGTISMESDLREKRLFLLRTLLDFKALYSHRVYFYLPCGDRLNKATVRKGALWRLHSFSHCWGREIPHHWVGQEKFLTGQRVGNQQNYSLWQNKNKIEVNQ